MKHELPKGLTVYAAVNDPFAGEQTAALLKNAGIKYVPSSNSPTPAEAIRVKADILLFECDISENPTSFSASFHDSCPGKPLVVLCDPESPEKLIPFIDMQVDGFLFKPVDPYKLFTVLGKAAERLVLERKLKEAESSLRHLLDTHPSFIVLARQHSLEVMNRNLLNYLGFDSMKDYLASESKLEDYIIEVNEEGYSHDPQEWIKAVVDNPIDREHIVKIINPRHPDKPANVYIAAFNQFPGLEDRFLITLSDISELEAEKQSLRDEASTDPLTKALNRRRFKEIISEAERRTREEKYSFSVIMFDIDHFKALNDNYGHDIGDVVLKEIVELVQESIRDHDALSRWGGEEFIVLASGVGLTTAVSIAERLRRKIKNFGFQGVPQRVTCSFGVAQYTPPESWEDLVKRTDTALYTSKNEGRNRVSSDKLRPA